MNNKKVKWEKLDIRLDYYFICGKGLGTEKTCGMIFFNNDDNVCCYCGSKNTQKIYGARLKGELFMGFINTSKNI